MEFCELLPAVCMTGHKHNRSPLSQFIPKIKANADKVEHKAGAVAIQTCLFATTSQILARRASTHNVSSEAVCSCDFPHIWPDFRSLEPVGVHQVLEKLAACWIFVYGEDKLDRMLERILHTPDARKKPNALQPSRHKVLFRATATFEGACS